MTRSKRPAFMCSATRPEKVREARRERRRVKPRSTKTVSDASPMSKRTDATARAGPPICCQMSTKLNCMMDLLVKRGA
jgi:hypothetical protein